MSALLPTPLGSDPVAAGSRRSGWMRLPRSRPRRALFLGAYLLFCLALPAGGLGLYWSLRAGKPLAGSIDVWDYYYPELRAIGASSPRHDDDRFDLLLLGGSVLEPAWGDVEHLLRERLEAEFPGRFRIDNLARSGHTSRDSLLKYSHLAGQQFDLVFAYEGINDVRMNNVSREMFRDDYTHCAWYRGFEKRRAAGSISLPAAIGQQLETLGESIEFGAPRDMAQAELGREIKTARTVAGNLAGIARLAAERHDPLLLATYAWYIPADYTRERFESQMLDYSYRADGRSCGAEMWGRPDLIGPVIDAQNTAIRELVADDARLGLVDLERAIAKAKVNFVDPCHLTAEGSRAFVDALWPAVRGRLEAWREIVDRR